MFIKFIQENFGPNKEGFQNSNFTNMQRKKNLKK